MKKDSAQSQNGKRSKALVVQFSKADNEQLPVLEHPPRNRTLRRSGAPPIIEEVRKQLDCDHDDTKPKLPPIDDGADILKARLRGPPARLGPQRDDLLVIEE